MGERRDARDAEPNEGEEEQDGPAHGVSVQGGPEELDVYRVGGNGRLRRERRARMSAVESAGLDRSRH